MPYARTLVWIGQRIVAMFDTLDDSQRRQIIKWGALAAAILGIVAVFGIVAMAISAFIKGLILFGSVVALLTSPVVLALSLIALAIAGLKTAWDNDWGGIKTKTRDHDAILAEVGALKLCGRVWILARPSESLARIQDAGKTRTYSSNRRS